MQSSEDGMKPFSETGLPSFTTELWHRSKLKTRSSQVRLTAVLQFSIWRWQKKLFHLTRTDSNGVSLATNSERRKSLKKWSKLRHNQSSLVKMRKNHYVMQAFSSLRHIHFCAIMFVFMNLCNEGKVEKHGTTSSCRWWMHEKENVFRQGNCLMLKNGKITLHDQFSSLKIGKISFPLWYNIFSPAFANGKKMSHIWVDRFNDVTRHSLDFIMTSNFTVLIPLALPSESKKWNSLKSFGSLFWIYSYVNS